MIDKPLIGEIYHSFSKVAKQEYAIAKDAIRMVEDYTFYERYISQSIYRIRADFGECRRVGSAFQHSCQHLKVGPHNFLHAIHTSELQDFMRSGFLLM